MFGRRQGATILKNVHGICELNAVLSGILLRFVNIPFEVHQAVYNRTPKRPSMYCCGPVWPVSFPKPQFATTSSDWATVSAILPRAAPQRLAPSLTRLIPTSLLPASGLDHLLCTRKLVRRPAQRHRSLRIEREHALHLSLAPDLVYRLQKALRRRRVHVSHLRHLAAGSARLE